MYVASYLYKCGCLNLTFIQTVLIMSHESGASLTIDAIGDFIRIFILKFSNKVAKIILNIRFNGGKHR